MSSRLKQRYLLSVVLLLTQGCALVSSQKDAGLSESGMQMLKEQRFLLAQYTERMDELIEGHYQLVDQVESLQRDVHSVNRLVASELKTLRDTQHKNTVKPTPPVKPLAKSLPASEPNKLVLGRYEWMWFDILGESLKARVDTGVTTSVIDCESIQPFERNGEKWVRYKILGQESQELHESPLVRKSKSRQNGDSPVVKLTVRLGGLTDDAEFVLLQRKSSNYPVLLGRHFLQDIALVDVAKKYTQPKYTPADQTVATP